MKISQLLILEFLSLFIDRFFVMFKLIGMRVSINFVDVDEVMSFIFLKCYLTIVVKYYFFELCHGEMF